VSIFFVPQNRNRFHDRIWNQFGKSITPLISCSICKRGTNSCRCDVVGVELLNSQKLMLEYEKYNELQAKSQRMQEDYENQLRELEKSKQGGLEELTEYYEAKLRETCARLEQVLTSSADPYSSMLID